MLTLCAIGGLSWCYPRRWVRRYRAGGLSVNWGVDKDRQALADEGLDPDDLVGVMGSCCCWWVRMLIGELGGEGFDASVDVVADDSHAFDAA